MGKPIESLRPFDAAAYVGIDLDRLVVYTAAQLDAMGVQLSLENIVAAAFKLFPAKFSLAGFPEFPDATRVEKSLWRSRAKARRWIGGKTPHGYFLTEESKVIAAKTADHLSGAPIQKTKTPTRSRRTESILREVAASPAYSKYRSGNGDAVTEADLCYVLQGTLDSSKETLRDNLSSLTRLAKDFGDEKVVTFAAWLCERFKTFIDE